VSKLLAKFGNTCPKSPALLLQRRMSVFGTKWTCRRAKAMSAFGGKPDIGYQSYPKAGKKTPRANPLYWNVAGCNFGDPIANWAVVMDLVKQMGQRDLIKRIEGSTKPRSSLMLASALLCLFAWAEPSFAQYSAQCVYLCTHVRTGDLLGFNMCFHNAPVCTGHPFDAVARGPANKSPAASGQATAAERVACRADFGKFCHDVVPGGGRGWACLAARKNELSPACQQKVARRGL
jgi:hypothetical protein